MKKTILKWQRQDIFCYRHFFAGGPVQRKSAICFSLFLFCLFFTAPTMAQSEMTIKGTVTDENGEGLPGANIQLKEALGVGTITDINGHYSLVISEVHKESTLIFSYIGYLTEEIQIGGRSVIDLQLLPNLQTLSEVVVIGYGSQQKSDVTGSLTHVTTDDFNKGAINSAQELIAGKAAGVTITSNSGAPGNASTIRIRGGASLNASNDPLIVIDGVPLDNTPLGGSPNILSTLNPNDIQSFTILKDASATAIFGSRASNGVIMVTTKRGGSKFTVNYNVTTSLYTTPQKVDVYSGDEFRDLINEVYADRPSVTELLGDANTDWQSEIYQNAFGQDHNLSVSGTLANMPYRISLGYNNTDGVLKTYNFERTTVGINLDPSFLNDHLKLKINLKGMDNNNNFAEQGAIANAVFYDPTKPVYNGNTRWWGYTTWTTGGINGDAINLATPNPVAQLELTDNTSNVKRSIGNAEIDYRFHFLPELRANLNLGYDYAKSEGHNNAAANTQWVYIPTVDGGRINPYEVESKNELLDFYLNYNKSLTSLDSKIDVTGGYSWSHFYRSHADSLMDQNMQGGVPNHFSTEYYLVAFFGRMNYTFKDKYRLTFTLRQDGTSRFSSENRWGLFPATAFSWDIDKEGFMQGNDFLSHLKLRVGYGITGQQDLIGGNNYPYLSTYTLSNETARYRFGDNYYYTLRPDGYDSNLKWEETATSNIGLDYGFFNGRLSGSLDYYYRETSDLLSYVDVAAGTNFFPRILTNVGSMVNQGIELNLDADLLVRQDLNWSIGYNVSYNENEITRLNLNNDPNYTVQVGNIAGTTSGTIQALRVNNPVNAFLVYQQIYDKNDQPLEGVYVDRNNDGLINTSDLYTYKQPAPLVMMGITSQLNYKKWDLSFTGRANFGNYVYNNVAAVSNYNEMEFLSTLRNGSKLAEEAKFRTGLNTNLSDFYIENASFFRMDNINLGYSFDKLFQHKLDLRLSAGIQNAFVITNYKGLDPEISGGIDNNFFPRSRVFLLGLNCQF